MSKKVFIITVIITALVVVFSGAAFAAPTTLTGEEKSTKQLVELSKPDDYFSTYSDLCQVSGTSKQGVRITVYIKKDKENTYEKLKMNNEEVSWSVGVSGYFLKEIQLERDKVNSAIIYAEKDDDFQVIKREITVKSETLKEILKKEYIKLSDLLSKIIKK